jgi:hypothetical protein
MNKRNGLWSSAIAASLLFAAATAAAADAEAPAVASAASTAPGHWLVRAEGSLVAMRDNWLSLPEPEVGLTVGRDVAPRFSLELTGSAREVGNDQRRSWSALAAGRWAAIASRDGQHTLTIAAGPFLEIDNFVHGTLPFAHAELAYVFRAPRGGLTVLAGAGVNVALATSPYVTPPSPCPNPNTGDSPTFCIDLGPDAQEIHPGDASIHLRAAVGWQF